MTNDKTIEYDEFGRQYLFSEHLQDGNGDSKNIDQGSPPIQCNKENANLISSLCQDGQHRPVLDIDFPVRLIPSTTPGHFHLYVDIPMTWEKQCTLMLAMENAGILQFGYRKYSESRGMSLVRPPWVKKPEKLDKTTTTE